MTSDFTVLWLQAGSCGGCSMASLSCEDHGLAETLRPFGVRFLWHPSFSLETGQEALDILRQAREGSIKVDALCIEGAAMIGPAGTGRFQLLSGTDEPLTHWIKDIAQHARYVVAVGSCATYGGIPAAAPTEATGLQLDGAEAGGLLGAEFRSTEGFKTINIAGCAPHPGWISETLTALALGGVTQEDFDDLGRPRFYADHLAHHGCARNEYYEFKASAQQLSQGGCLMENLGCKATQAAGDCSKRSWNGGGSCASSGYPCIACTEPSFEKAQGGFQSTPKVAGIPVGLPVDMPKAWFVALAALSKSATPERVKANAEADHVVSPPKSKLDRG